MEGVAHQTQVRQFQWNMEGSFGEEEVINCVQAYDRSFLKCETENSMSWQTSVCATINGVEKALLEGGTFTQFD